MARLTLRRRLTLLVALAIVVPITVVGVVVLDLIGNEGEERTLDRLQLTSGFAASWLESEALRLDASATALADSSSLAEAMASDQLESVLADVLRREGLDALVVVDAGGAIVGRALREAALAAGTDPPTAEAVVAGTLPAALTADATAPFGVVYVATWLDANRLADLVRSREVAITVADRANRVLASTADIGGLPDGALSGEFSASFGGERRFAVATPLPGGAGVLLVSSPPDVVGTTGRLALILGMLLVVLLVLVVLVGYVVSGLVTGPVELLVDAAMAVSRGELDKRVEVKGDRELVALGRAFNQMTDNLRQYVSQLQQSRSEFQSAISRLGDVLVSTHDIGGILDVVLEAATLTLKAEVAVFYERIAMPARIRASAVWGSPGAALPDIELNGTGVAGGAAKDLAPVTFPGNGWLDLSEPVVSSAIAVPVRSDSRLFGVLAVYGRQKDSVFTPEDVDTLSTLARQAEVAIGNVVLHDETRRQARTDGLTGLWNRREFELRAREAVKEAERFGEPFGVVLVDIDNFKLVNDRYDHTTGDAALIWIASKLSEATREIDVVARWGGEEFIVLLPRAGVDESATVAERIRVAVAREPMVDGSRSIPLTVSVGFAVRPHDGGSADELFKVADAALLRAKRAGKNRVERAEPDQGVA